MNWLGNRLSLDLHGICATHRGHVRWMVQFCWRWFLVLEQRVSSIQEQLQLDRANNDKIDPFFNISYDVLPFESGGGPLQLSYGNYLGAYARTWQKSRRNTLADSTSIIAVSLSKVSVHPCRKRTADGLSSPTTFLPRVKKCGGGFPLTASSS